MISFTVTLNIPTFMQAMFLLTAILQTSFLFYLSRRKMMRKDLV
jgi:hypothetical protein